MDMGQMVLLGLLGAFLAMLLKKENPQFALLVAMITGILLFLGIFTPLHEILNMLHDMADTAGVSEMYFGIVLKVIGIAYLSQFGAQLCTDAGESAIAAKIELAGKVLIMAVSAPVLKGLLDVVLSLV